MTTVSYSIFLNGSSFGLFRPKRGLRQGDPLSFFLFILGTSVLSRLLVRAEVSGSIHCTRISRSAPPISHLLFADDTLVFARANPQEVEVIRQIFATYLDWSG